MNCIFLLQCNKNKIKYIFVKLKFSYKKNLQNIRLHLNEPNKIVYNIYNNLHVCPAVSPITNFQTIIEN